MNETITCKIYACRDQGENSQSNQICCVKCKYASDKLGIHNIDYKHKTYDRKSAAYEIII